MTAAICILGWRNWGGRDSERKWETSVKERAGVQQLAGLDASMVTQHQSVNQSIIYWLVKE